MADTLITSVVNTPSSQIPNLTGNNTWTGSNEFDGALNVDGAADFDSTVTMDGATTLNGALGGTSVKDEDNMASDSATAVPTQQSTKAYADTKVAKAGDSMTGPLSITSTNTQQVWKYDTSNFADIKVSSGGAVELGATGVDAGFFFQDSTYLKSDSNKQYFGAGNDMSIDYDGTNGNIKTDLVAASDLHVDCGTDKTVVLDETVYNDANVGSLVLVTGGTLPGVVEIIDNTGAGTGIYSRGFAVGEQGSGSIEIPHDYKEGTDLVFHVHWVGQDAPTGTDNVKWELTYTIADGGTTTPPATTDSNETAIDTQYKWYRTDVETITGTNLKIGDQVNFTIKRIAASGDAYAGEAVVATIGFHYQCDTLGSRQITTK